MKLLATLFAVGFLSLSSVGCKHDDDMDHHHGMRNDSMSMKDDCTHCDGQQTANADGTCPVCHAKVKKM